MAKAGAENYRNPQPDPETLDMIKHCLGKYLPPETFELETRDSLTADESKDDDRPVSPGESDLPLGSD